MMDYTIRLHAHLQNFIAHLTSLKQGGVANGKALHKPVMLLALMDTLEHRQVDTTPEYIPVDDQLKMRFDDVWNLLIPGTRSGNFFKPVFHLPNEGFWSVFTATGQPATKEYSSLKGTAADGLWSRFQMEYSALLQSPEAREIVRMVILDTYFNSTKQRYCNVHGQAELIVEKESLLHVNEPTPKYIRRLQFVHFEGFVRHWKFRTNILQIYDHTCCISGLRAQKGALHPLVDACHIEDHARSGTDHLDNGLALCKNLHAAFDSGLISLTDDYRVLVHKDLEESDSGYGLQRLLGQRIRLPLQQEHYPGKAYLAAHRERWLT